MCFVIKVDRNIKYIYSCHGVFVLHSSRVTFFGLTCRRSRLEHVIMWHFELSSFSIENRFLMTVHLWENCNFVEVQMFWQVYRFWSPLLLEFYRFRIKSITIRFTLPSFVFSHVYFLLRCRTVGFNFSQELLCTTWVKTAEGLCQNKSILIILLSQTE